MREIRFHGRGGQGTVLAAKIIADAVLRSGRGQCVAVPEFGVERRGAPVVAYARVSEGEIRARTRIHTPDAVVILETGSASGSVVTSGLKPGGLILMNSDLDAAAAASRFPGYRVIPVPARRIALARRLGPASAPLVNTAMAGALCAALDLADEASLASAVRDSVPVKPDENAAAALEAFALCRAEVQHAPTA